MKEIRLLNRIRLRDGYKELTGNHWKNSTEQPTVEYTRWLEEKILQNSSISDIIGKDDSTVKEDLKS